MKCVYVCIFVCMYVRTYVRTDVCMYICMNVRYANILVRVFTIVFIHINKTYDRNPNSVHGSRWVELIPIDIFDEEIGTAPWQSSSAVVL